MSCKRSGSKSRRQAQANKIVCDDVDMFLFKVRTYALSQYEIIEL